MERNPSPYCHQPHQPSKLSVLPSLCLRSGFKGWRVFFLFFFSFQRSTIHFYSTPSPLLLHHCFLSTGPFLSANKWVLASFKKRNKTPFLISCFQLVRAPFLCSCRHQFPERIWNHFLASHSAPNSPIRASGLFPGAILVMEMQRS